jgi:transcriptional regulator with XRE-family HTH domain
MAKGKYEYWITDDGLLLLSGWARDGLTDEQIAKNMHISAATLYNWKRDHLEILEALKKSKEIADTEVENALFKRALGYNFTEVKTETDIEGNERVTKTIKHMAPDTTAQIFWLKNRKSSKWRANPEVEKSLDIINKNIQSIAGLINAPVQNRTIEEIEDE